MLLLLPPSETKRDGGKAGTALELTALSFPSLHETRERVLAAFERMMANPTTASTALALGPTQAHELERNISVRSSAVMPAIERYTGVLYDGLDAATLSASARRFASSHLAIHSALFGLVLADDRIPAYRLSHNTRLPGTTLSSSWKSPITTALAERDEFVLDLRSESYAALGPAPQGSVTIRVVTESPTGVRKALSHFNKKAKGEFTRAVVEAAIDHESVQSLLGWASANGIRLESGNAAHLDLVV
jgi:uncharacterized protein